MGELLLELLSEEIPARMQRRALDDLTALIRDKLAAADIPPTAISGYVTPRRLTVVAGGTPARQPDREEERRGPRVGSPEQAIAGFLRATGLSSIDQCEVRGEFYFAVMKRPGRATAEVLPELIHAAMTALPWPKSMRYPASELRWVRPLNSVVCLFDGEVVKLPLDEVPVGRVTRGHRFLSPSEITVADAADYRAKLAKAHVVLDWRERRSKIEADLKKQAGNAGLVLKDDPGLLDEVAGLVEYPVVLMGSIDADFVRPLPDGLPPEVLATAMRTHQKYFTCLNPEPAPATAGGTPAPRFLFVANNATPDDGAAIVAGNERVLRARLSDAKFFWDQDRKVRLEDRVDALKQRVYHEKLGSVYDKVERVAQLIYLCPSLVASAGADNETAFRAALLAKSDLSTGMVGEFPELQGVMGRYYALDQGKDARVANAIGDHYKPLGPNDNCPTAAESVVVALADKIDSLVVFFAAGEKPTGSRDPFALRRAALGVIRLILENELRLPLRQVFEVAWKGAINIEGSDPSEELLGFLAERLKVHLREQGLRHDLIAAAFVQTVGLQQEKHAEDDLVRLMWRVNALGSFLETDDGANLLTAYRRAANIVAIEEKRDGRSYGDHPPDLTLGMLKLPEERRLEGSLRALHSSGTLRMEDFPKIMAELAKLRRPIDEFFDRVTVNTDETVTLEGKARSLRENRLRLLSTIRATMNNVADFSQIEG